MAKLIVIGNYPPDGQQSMNRYAQMLAEGVEKFGIASEIWRPAARIARGQLSTVSGVGKWLGYLDKWLFYPLELRRRVARLRRTGSLFNIRFHIADHSNAFYLRFLPKPQTGITCHDVLAIRGARGDASAFCPASRMGRQLQAWILRNLCRAQRLAAVSATTLKQLEALAEGERTALDLNQRDWRVILNALNADFAPMKCSVAERLVEGVKLNLQRPFILHVGSNLPRKNRAMLLDMVAAKPEAFSGQICFAGAPIEAQLRQQANALGLTERVVEVINPPFEVLQALYSSCHAFVFPSFSEGFGWPVIEAQACGAPVISSSRQPMPEVSGGSALHADPEDSSAFAAALQDLAEASRRQALVEAGYENVKRFQPERMIREILALYGLESSKEDAEVA